MRQYKMNNSENQKYAAYVCYDIGLHVRHQVGLATNQYDELAVSCCKFPQLTVYYSDNGCHYKKSFFMVNDMVSKGVSKGECEKLCE